MNFFVEKFINIQNLLSTKLIFDKNTDRKKRRIEQIQKRQKYLNETDSLKAEKSTFNSTQTPTKIDELNFTLQSFLKKNQDLNNNSNIENNYINKNLLSLNLFYEKEIENEEQFFEEKEVNISNINCNINELNNEESIKFNNLINDISSSEYAKKFCSSKLKSFIQLNNNLIAKNKIKNNSPSYLLALFPEILKNKNFISSNYTVNEIIKEENEIENLTKENNEKSIKLINKTLNTENKDFEKKIFHKKSKSGNCIQKLLNNKIEYLLNFNKNNQVKNNNILNHVLNNFKTISPYYTKLYFSPLKNQYSNKTFRKKPISNYKNTNNKINKSINGINKSKKDLNKSKKDLNKSKNELSKSIKDLSKSIIGINKSKNYLQKSKNELSKSKKDISKTKNELINSINGMNKSKKDLKTIKNELSKSKKDISKTKNELNKSKKDLSKIINRMNKCKKDIKTIKNEISKSKKDISKSKNELNKSINGMNKSRKDLSKSKNELSKSKKDLSKSKNEISKSKNEISRKIKNNINTNIKNIIMNIHNQNKKVSLSNKSEKTKLKIFTYNSYSCSKSLNTHFKNKSSFIAPFYNKKESKTFRINNLKIINKNNFGLFDLKKSLQLKINNQDQNIKNVNSLIFPISHILEKKNINLTYSSFLKVNYSYRNKNNLKKMSLSPLK